MAFPVRIPMDSSSSICPVPSRPMTDGWGLLFQPASVWSFLPPVLVYLISRDTPCSDVGVAGAPFK